MENDNLILLDKFDVVSIMVVSRKLTFKLISKFNSKLNSMNTQQTRYWKVVDSSLLSAFTQLKSFAHNNRKHSQLNAALIEDSLSREGMHIDYVKNNLRLIIDWDN